MVREDMGDVDSVDKSKMQTVNLAMLLAKGVRAHIHIQFCPHLGAMNF